MERAGYVPAVKRVLGVLLLLLLSPLILSVMLASLLLKPFTKPASRSAEEVARYLRAFRDGAGDDWDFDEFLGERIADPRLEAIRKRVLALEDVADPQALAALIAEAETIAARDEMPPTG